MAREWNDFGADTTGQTPAGWARVGTATLDTLKVEGDAAASQQKVLRLAYAASGGGSGTGRASYVRSGGLLASSGQTQEVSARVRFTSAAVPQYAVMARASASTANSSLVAGFNTDGTVGIARMGSTTYVSAPFAWTTNTWYRVLLRVEGAAPNIVARLKVWADSDPVPGVWTVELSGHAAINLASLNTGYAGLALQYPLSGTLSVDADWVSVATGADSAWTEPPVPPSPGFTWSALNATVTVASMAAQGTGAIVSTEYDYGDGTGWTAATSHAYADFGAYLVSQRVIDVYGQQSTAAQHVTTGSAGRATAAEYALWASGRSVVHVDVQIERVIGGVPTFQSYRDLGGWNWIRSLRFSPAQVDAPIGSGTVILHRERGGQSLSPLVKGSPLNQDGGSYSPAIDFGREIRILTAETPALGLVTTTAPAAVGAELIAVQPLAHAAGLGSVVHLPIGPVYLVSDADAGATTLAVSPLPAALAAGVNAPVSREPAAAGWREVFVGTTDDPAWGGRDAQQVSVPFRDLGGALADTYVRDEKTYGSAGGVPLGAVAQQIADDLMGAGQYIIAQHPEPVDFDVTGYTISEVSAWEALETLADQASGAALRQMWIASASEYRIAIVTVPRGKTAPDYAVGPSTYLDAPEVATGQKNLRTILRVYGVNGSTGAEMMKQIPAEADISADPKVQLYGRRFMQLGEDATKGIGTQAQLDEYAAAVYADVSDPPIPLEMETRYCWFAEPDQVVRWMPNTILWDEALDSAVLGVSHEFPSPGVGRTRWKTAGRPKGAYAAWTRKGAKLAGRNAKPAGYYGFTEAKFDKALDTATHKAFVFTAGPGVTSVRAAALLFQGGTPNSTDARNAVINAAAPVVSPIMIPKAQRSPHFALAMLQTGWVSAAGVQQWGQRLWQPVIPVPAYAPKFLVLDVVDQRVKVAGENIAAIRVERLQAPTGGEYASTVDGATATFDLSAALPSAATWEVKVTAYNDPQAEWDADTLSVSETRIVRGAGAIAENVVQSIVPAAPPVGSDVMSVAVSSETRAGYTMQMDARFALGADLPAEWTENVATAPALGAPGGTQTVTIATGFTRSGGQADGSELTVTYEVRVRVREPGGSVVDSRAAVCSWYLASGT